MKFAAALLFAACTSGAVSAQTWVTVGEGSVGLLYIEVASIRAQGVYMKAWTRYSLKEPKMSHWYPQVRYGSMQQLTYFDCKSETTADKQTIYYEEADGGGKNVAKRIPQGFST